MSDKTNLIGYSRHIESALCASKTDLLVFESIGEDPFLRRQTESNKDSFQMIYVLSGCAACHCVDGRLKRVGPHECLLIPAAMPHRLVIEAGDAFRVYYLRFRNKELSFPICKHIYDHKLQLLPILNTLYEEEQTETPSPLLREYLFGAALLLLLKSEHSHKINAPTFERALLYMKSHLGEALNVEEMARNLYVSPSYLCRIFRKKLNKTVMQHLNDMRTEAAKRLLVETQMGVEEIAYKIGFNTPKHFSRLFKARTGMTPTQFRQNDKE